MKPIIFSMTLILASAMAEEALATCGVNQITNVDLSTLVSNKTICEVAGNATNPGPDKSWGVQEEHRAGGELWDYKRGPLSTIDPPTKIGTWSTTNGGPNAKVSYTYIGGGGSGSYKVYNNLDSTYDFCKVSDGSLVATVTVVNNINVGCTGFAHGAP
jgi:hypothetical protein